jgi:hypothetical protein
VGEVVAAGQGRLDGGRGSQVGEGEQGTRSVVTWALGSGRPSTAFGSGLGLCWAQPFARIVWHIKPMPAVQHIPSINKW